MKGYGSFCPVAKAAEIITERWTPLVLRELLLGSRHFNQLRRGIPQMSPTLLSKRLQTLEEAGLISRQSTIMGIGSTIQTKRPGKPGQLSMHWAIGAIGGRAASSHLTNSTRAGLCGICAARSI